MVKLLSVEGKKYKMSPIQAIEIINDCGINNDDGLLKTCIDVLEKTDPESKDILKFTPIYNSSIKNFLGCENYYVACDLFAQKIFSRLSDLHPTDYDVVLPKILFPFLPSDFNIEGQSVLVDVCNGATLTEAQKKHLLEQLSIDFINNVIGINAQYECFKNFKSFVNIIESTDVLLKYSPVYSDILMSLTNDEKYGECCLSDSVLKLFKIGIPIFLNSVEKTGGSADAEKLVTDKILFFIYKMNLNKHLEESLMSPDIVSDLADVRRNKI